MCISRYATGANKIAIYVLMGNHSTRKFTLPSYNASATKPHISKEPVVV